jgi:serpin B
MGKIVLSADLQKRVAQDNTFAFDLLSNIIKVSDEKNVFISPLSVSIALGMARNGANGTTRTEMETALKMSGLTSEQINQYYKIMLDSLPGADEKTKLSIANSIWCREGFPVKKSFLDINKEYFNSEVRNLDFSKSWAADTINNWCARKTNDLIKNVVTPPIPETTMAYIINAIYFKGVWTKQFDKKGTYSGIFTSETGKSNEVNMMSMLDTLPYFKDSYAQYVDIPYGNKTFSMTVILPNEGKSTTDVINYLGADKLSELNNKLSLQKVKINLPRFKVENNFSLKPVLKYMGMLQAFKVDADFKGIVDGDLFINDVKHITYVSVTEDGTEAAAVTSIIFGTTSMPEYPIVYVDKPFIFLIREKGTGVILFTGKIGNVEKY